MKNLKLLLGVCISAISQVSVAQSDALSFDGTTTYVSVANANALNIPNNLTVEAWVQLNKVTGVNMIVSKGWCASSDFGYALSINDGKIRWTWNMNGNCNNSSILDSDNIVFNAGECHHIAIVHKMNGIDVYLDGNLVSYSMTTGSFSSIYGSSEPLRMGTYRGLSGSLGSFLNGKIDELKFWNIARSQSEVQFSMSNELVGNESNLVAYYNFENLVVGSNMTVPNVADATSNTLSGICNATSPQVAISCATFSHLGEQEELLNQIGFDVLIAPNPASSSVNVFFSEGDLSKKIVVLDTQGKIVLEAETNDMNTNIDLVELNIGIYYFQISVPNRPKITRKVIKS